MNPTEGAVPPLVLRLFGPFDARVNGAPLPRLRSHKGQWLLALLALRHGRVVERGWLAGTLWPDSPDRKAYASLRISLADLRRALGPEASRLHSSTPSTLTLDLSGADVDVLTFDAAIARGDSAALKCAVALRRGALLEGCPCEWVLEERQPRERAYLAGLESLAEQAALRGDHAAAVSWLHRAAAVDPVREATQRALMQALAAEGSYAAALKVYRDLRWLLNQELGAEPGPETLVLFEEIRAAARRHAETGGKGDQAPVRRGVGVHVGPADPTPTPPVAPSTDHSFASSPSGRIPRPLTDLVGRDVEVLAVRACLTRARLVTLTGPGGIGKTRIAIRVAEEVAAEVGEGTWFVELEALAVPTLVPQAVAAALGLNERPRRSPKEALVRLLRGREALLVLDNCEHLVEACAQLATGLLHDCPGLRILATSRQPLGVTGEAAYRVPSLSVPGSAGVSPASVRSTRCAGTRGQTPALPGILPQSEAVRLFVERAMDAAPEFALTEKNAPAVAQICRQLDGIPLAIELAAARLKLLSVEQIAARLKVDFRFLTGGSRSALPRQQTLRATMDWSHGLLSEPEQILFRRLAVFTGGFTLDAAEAICGDFGLSLEESPIQNPRSRIHNGEVLDLLGQLVDKSLVVSEGAEAEVRCRLLETVRQYAAEKLREAGEWEAVRSRHRDWYLALAEQAEPALKGPVQGAWLDRLEREHDNLRAALASCLEHDPPGRLASEGWRLAAALARFWSIRGYRTEGRKWLAELLALDDRMGDPELAAARARALEAAGVLAEQQSDLGNARRLLEESLAIRRRLEDRQGIAATLRALGTVIEAEGDHQAAWCLGEESLAIRREIGEAWEIADSLFQLGKLARAEWQAETAERLLRESLEIHRRLGDHRSMARALIPLGLVARQRGDYPAAHRCLAEALAIVRRLNDREETVWALVSLADLALNQGEYERASALFEESLDLWQELGDQGGLAGALTGLGRAALLQGDLAAARPFLEESLAISRERRAPRTVAWTLGLLADLALREGDDEAALSWVRESIAIRQQLGERRGIACSLFVLGQVARFRGDTAGARAHCQQSLLIWRDQGAKPEIPPYLEALAEVAGLQGEPERAARLWGAVEALRESIGVPCPPMDHPRCQDGIAAARAALSDELFTAAWAEGRAMPLDEAIAEALR